MVRGRTALVMATVATLLLGGSSGALAASGPRHPGKDEIRPPAVVKQDDFKKREACGTDTKDPVRKKQTRADQLKIAKALADELGVSLGKAMRAVKELDALSEQGGVDIDSAEFAAIAERLGVSPARLDKAMRAVKRAFAENEGQDKMDKRTDPADGS
ncbi:hypothetical protein MF672_013640 [Actinomadura sp. ATCC 31491]|uniref:Uncharacterized protein n=1 Tax=Actinomadura luzonensis TaxID=2805427 RepID=A0ABT0FR72_9ACTN|nr:hypothetical protein [Actinomadura luzonensis]MCK2214827.1 hypothetical protein [Actinomadura luzonensis]